jgi:DNA-binding NtrC family response regulator
MSLQRQSHAVSGRLGKFSQIRILGEHPSMRALVGQAIAVGQRRCTTIIHGESGTGKELLARQIHFAGPRADGPFVPVDCSTLRDSLLESQLFGHVRGAFTGAACNTQGFLRAADGGTLFLDEIGELPAQGQAKLLRCLQEREVMPLGSFRAIPVDVCVIAATHRSLSDMVAAGQFRSDLFFRLNVVTLKVPSLRDRKQDIPLLAEGFLEDIAANFEEERHTLSRAAMDRLQAYHWPGNVRELQNILQRACALASGTVLSPEDLPSELAAPSNNSAAIVSDEIAPLLEVERRAVASALRINGGNQSRAALALRVERHRLRRMISRHGLESLIC